MSGSRRGRILALDVGEARIGLAVCDALRTLACPIPAIERGAAPDDAARIVETAAREEAVRIVVGLPLMMDGTHGAQARAMLRFCSALRETASVPVETWDERLSTVEAASRLREAGVQASRDRARLDSAAAAVILQAYLDAHRSAERGPR